MLLKRAPDKKTLRPKYRSGLGEDDQPVEGASCCRTMDLACGFRARAGLETDAGYRMSEARCQTVDRGSASPPPAGNETCLAGCDSEPTWEDCDNLSSAGVVESSVTRGLVEGNPALGVSGRGRTPLRLGREQQPNGEKGGSSLREVKGLVWAPCPTGDHSTTRPTGPRQLHGAVAMLIISRILGHPSSKVLSLRHVLAAFVTHF
ncbi:predicted protein [Chaetomium globosum CBS 148.51]|uniref:Uncharacterized protein n=1 Tax=Chaetomium globosum (strain ATCC 6205 / CBS 148.51 / DSM 1962 / NBRC 6347 / NRRL 1970) TaxID=306901 RepID=Q2HDK2_CHAGB|nr:uncharacterized protein CHGG_01702 [Chaetomium globosum CBS 148.51]EAQ93467.1 predicted protein [Chaetomium globosum CBS 148.51]